MGLVEVPAQESRSGRRHTRYCSHTKSVTYYHRRSTGRSIRMTPRGSDHFANTGVPVWSRRDTLAASLCMPSWRHSCRRGRMERGSLLRPRTGRSLSTDPRNSRTRPRCHLRRRRRRVPSRMRRRGSRYRACTAGRRGPHPNREIVRSTALLPAARLPRRGRPAQRSPGSPAVDGPSAMGARCLHIAWPRAFSLAVPYHDAEQLGDAAPSDPIRHDAHELRTL